MDLPYAHQDFCQCDGEPWLPRDTRRPSPQICLLSKFLCSLEECRPLHDPKRGIVFDALQAPIRKGFAVVKRLWECSRSSPNSMGNEVDVVQSPPSPWPPQLLTACLQFCYV